MIGVKALTPRQEAFAQKFVECGNASEAYRSAYSYKNMKINTINRKAKALVDDPKVGAHITKMRHLAQKSFVITVEKKKQWLERIIEDGMKQKVKEEDGETIAVGMQDRKAAISAIAELNKMDGDLAAIKSENKNINENTDLTEQQLDERIAQLSAKA